MREIKFRGKDAQWDWHYGYLVGDSDIYDTWTEERYKVLEETIGQYTDLKDKNGVEIYEGDILKLDSWEGLHKVVFEDGAFCLDSGNGYLDDIHYAHHAGINQATVLDNIFDNMDLINQ